MPDREKVIKSLKWFRDRDSWREGIMIHDDHAEVRKLICDNAIELLKEEEAQILTIDDAVSELMDKHFEYQKKQKEVVHPEPSCEMTYITDCCCDLCGVQLIREDNFCRCCGKPIVWEGR